MAPLDFNDAFARYEAGERESLLPGLGASVGAATPDARLWHLHGLILRELERYSEALPSLRRAAQLAPGSVKIAHALARAAYEAGLPSVEAYGQTLRLSPGDPDLVLGLVAALAAEGRIGDAIAGLERSLSLTPHWIQGHETLANLRWTEGEREGFARSFDEALATTPGNVDLRRKQIITLIHAEQWDESLAAIAAGRTALGDDPMFDANEAAVYSETGEPERAQPIFEGLADFPDATVQLRHVRNLLRLRRASDASMLIDAWLPSPTAFLFWPYASIAWRMTSDPRFEWLEGDPRFVGVYDIADRLPPLDKLAETLRRLHTMRGEHLDQSVRGGTQTDGNLFYRVDPVIAQVREAICATVAEHVAQLPSADERHPLLAPPRDRPIRFAGAWSVRLSGGGYHANHVHPYGWISSALYVVLPPEIGEGEAGFLTLGEPQAQLKMDLMPTGLVEPKPGRLVLFPSWMWHGTRPFGAGERMTIAFDVAFPR
ncbi:MAG TPA: putative 2OG-Fe(II) oxygenase [Sphingomicrobium sp.]